MAALPTPWNDGKWKIVEGLDVNDFSRERIDTTVAELKQERDTVKAQGLI